VPLEECVTFLAELQAIRVLVAAFATDDHAAASFSPCSSQHTVVPTVSSPRRRTTLQ
jgi:hypothetical protein